MIWDAGPDIEGFIQRYWDVLVNSRMRKIKEFQEMATENCAGLLDNSIEGYDIFVGIYVAIR